MDRRLTNAAGASQPDTELSELHELVVREMSIVARRLRTRLDEHLRELGMTHAKWTVLQRLWQADGGLRQAELAELLGVEAGALVRIIDVLEARGLVVREAVPGDRRIKQLRLTEQAIPLVERLDAKIRALHAATLSGLDAPALETALHVLVSVKRRLEYC